LTLAKNHIVIHNDLSIFYTYGTSKKIHANHCVKIVISQSPIVVSHHHKKISSKGFILKSDTSHKVAANDGLLISIYIDPETEIGKAVNGFFNHNKILKIKEQVSDKLLKFFRSSFDQHTTELEIKKFLAKTLVDVDLLDVEHSIDSRIQQVIEQIRFADNFNIKFADLLTSCALSESRLMHLFKKETGITIRKYILWCRLQKATKAITTGTSIKQAAKSSGFTDAPHLTRTFVSMYGIAPSLMLR
jgi:AraC-like DNA-binding protein